MHYHLPRGVSVSPRPLRVAHRVASFHSNRMLPSRDGRLSSNESCPSPDILKVDIPESSFPDLYTSSIFTGKGESPRSDVNQVAQPTARTGQVRSAFDSPTRHSEPPPTKRQPKTHKDNDMSSDPLRMATKFNKEYNLKGWRLDEDGNVLTPLEGVQRDDTRPRPNVKYLDPGSISDDDWSLLKGTKVDEIDMGQICRDIHDRMGFESNASEFLDARPSTAEDAVPKFTDIRYATSYTYIVHKDRTVTLEIPGEVWPLSTEYLVNFPTTQEAKKKRYPLVPKLKEGIQTSADFNRAYMKEYPMEPLFRAILEANYSERSIHMHNVIADADALISLFTCLKSINNNAENPQQVSMECTKVNGRTILSALDVVVPENRSLNLRTKRRLADTARASVYEIASLSYNASRTPISFEKGFAVRPHFRINSMQFGKDFWMLVRFRVDARKVKASVNTEEQQLFDEQYIDKLPSKPRLTYTDIPAPSQKISAPYVPDKYKLTTIKSAKYEFERVKNYDAYFTRIQNQIIARYNWRCDRLATIQANILAGTYFQNFEEQYASELIALRKVLDRFTQLEDGQYIIRNDRDTLMIYHKRDGKVDVLPSDVRAYVTEHKKRPSVVEELQFNMV
ncbi:hypothetical protein V1509DRAFT_621616 [Lipomyces kononenkoae]